MICFHDWVTEIKGESDWAPLGLIICVLGALSAGVGLILGISISYWFLFGLPGIILAPIGYNIDHVHDRLCVKCDKLDLSCHRKHEAAKEYHRLTQTIRDRIKDYKKKMV